MAFSFVMQIANNNFYSQKLFAKLIYEKYELALLACSNKR